MPIQILPNRTRPSRRGFLAGLVGGAAALAAGRSSKADARPDGWFALVSDTHIGADPAARLRGQVMGDNLRAVVADIMAAETPPLGAVIDGDLALLDGREADYRTLVTLLEPLRVAKIPLHLALGNHDDRVHFREALRDLVPAGSRVADKQVAVVEGPGVRFVILDSLDRVNGTPGKLGAPQLEWLAGALDVRPKDPTLVFVHHNLSNESKTALTDTRPLLDVLSPRRQVKAVVFGHTHVWDVREEGGLYWINLPAVAYPFGPGQPLGWCRFRPSEGGGELELRCVGGDRKADRHRVELRWRDS